LNEAKQIPQYNMFTLSHPAKSIQKHHEYGYIIYGYHIIITITEIDFSEKKVYFTMKEIVSSNEENKEIGEYINKAIAEKETIGPTVFQYILELPSTHAA
jgi:hypothetical protein